MRGVTASPVSLTDCRSFFMPIKLEGSFTRGNRKSRGFVPGLLLVRGAPGSVLESFEVRRVLLVIFLMVILRRIKLHRRQNFGRDRLIELAGVGEFFF